MKKLMTILAVLALAGAVSAQKKKPAANPAATLDTAKAKGAQDAAKAKADAAQADLAAKATDATAVDESQFSISVWGGYNIAGKSDYTNNREALFESTGAKASGVTTPAISSKKMGGIAAGLDLWYGKQFQMGLGFGYLQGHNIEATAKDGAGDGLKLTATMNYLPTLLQARYYVFEGLYAGAGLGVAFLSNGTDVVKETSGTSNTLSDVTYKGRVLALQGRVGYDFNLSSNLSLGVVGVFTYFTGEAETVIYSATGTSLEKVTLKLDALHITPSLAVTLKF